MWHYHGDERKLLWIRGRGSTTTTAVKVKKNQVLIAQKPLIYQNHSEMEENFFTSTAMVLPWPWKQCNFTSVTMVVPLSSTSR